MKLKSTQKIISKSVPGVTVTFRSIGPSLRSAIDIDTAKHRRALREAVSDFTVLKEKAPGIVSGEPAATPEELLESTEINERFAMAQREINFAWIRATLLKVEGIDIDDKPMTADTFIEFAPEELFVEVSDAIKNAAFLSPEEAANLQSPTTSGAPVDGPTKTTTAPDAKQQESMPDATAHSTSPTE